ncbi:low molecular weight phosphotyrosine protein phosphatase [Carbonactinospora thermoautotrophica]|uniref:protein-tyrosine-phosphatase n=1 Tax=Carbonactinospora thermoautotrophica TaxID=1469144 RepID=A0A132MKN9_9ACTN|nr:low molecular weight protein-tyrosine-phosphatase [Carbonactinospora thermoautotrophica]KWW98424.1 Low molecular weight protein tyrosine phosphatase [Carbonactinospora thermoautotrophica]MCX9192051.1 low molecular weight phosphotyrosine protein phosphatase [Carbonactinospora thermoautotrophica]
MSEPYRVTFVCSGNICRSPMAEAVFRRCVAQAGLDGQVEVDSSGTGSWHVGEPADWRAVEALRGRGYACDHRARQFSADWFDRYDLIVAMDQGHVRALRRLAPDTQAAWKVRLLREFDPAAGDDLDVPDPYYGGQADFEHVLDLIEAACPALLDEVRRGLKEKSASSRHPAELPGQPAEGGGPTTGPAATPLPGEPR